MNEALLQPNAGLPLAQWLAVAALIVSLMSLSVSILVYRRDRPLLKLETRIFYSEARDERPGFIEVKIVNAGRRPVFLLMLWGKDKRGSGSGSFFDYGGPGIKLGEHEFKTFRITHLRRGIDEFDAVGCGDDDMFDFDHMWVEDSLGKRHKLPNMPKLLRELRADYRDWCERTGYWKWPASAAPGNVAPEEGGAT